MSKLTHFDEAGKAVMVDVGEKAETRRRAVASARVLLNEETIGAIKNNQTPKGNPLEIARIAGIMAAKQTSNLIPLCHQINLSKVEIRAELTDYGVSLESEAITTAQTGVEMEALTAVSIAALTIYDMCKALDKAITITDIRLEAKTGGKSGDFERAKIQD
ncbi:MAG TPA: cyclic pyranopterin monophosphate synthase MoaC [Pyrinomonadaceae bacterium]|jgi:cyclic pyranopterin phosphate synthase